MNPMPPKKKISTCCNRVFDTLKDLFAYRMTLRQKFGKSQFAVPVWLVIILLILSSHLVLVVLLVALIAGYRVSFERG